MALSHEDKLNVEHKMGSKMANRVEKATIDKKKEVAKRMSSYERINKERKHQGYKPIKDRATKGLYDFLDKYE